MTTTLVTGTFTLPTFTDLRFAAAVAGRTLPGFVDVATALSSVLDASVSDVTSAEDLVSVTFTMFGGWGTLTAEVAGALAACGVSGWASDESDLALELTDATVVWTELEGSDPLAFFDALTF